MNRRNAGDRADGAVRLSQDWKEQRRNQRKSIRKRWMLNSIGIVLLLVVVVVAAFSFAMANYYYTNMRIDLESVVNTRANYMRKYSSSSEYASAARNEAAAFEQRNDLELQYLSRDGLVQASSSELTVAAGTAPRTTDITRAIEQRKTSFWTGRDPNTGESVMAVTAPVLYNDTLVGLVRVVTSLRLVNREIMLAAVAVALIGVCVLAIVYFSNLYFIRSIVEPVADITDTAKRIAAGSYGIQMEKKFDDEIGDLTDAINDMSMKIDQAEKTQSEFISSVSHELRTPLTAINGWAETLCNGEVRSPEDVRKGMGIIVSEARRLTNMVEELLEFSRIEDGRFTLSVEPIDIKAEVEDAVYTYREFFLRKGLALEYDECEEEFPTMEGDPERLRQVFCNLLDNADKHGGAGKRVDVSLRREGDAAVLRIRDHGPGIPEEELPHVKYKFYKGSSKARGSGIGLAVCEEIVTRHSGKLTIGNAPGGGCLVTVALPLEG